MKLESVKKIPLSADGTTYSGWGYFENGEFIPNGCGKKYYPEFYAYGNFENGILSGPAIVDYPYYVYTMQFANNRGNGWGLYINNGDLVEFGYYKDSQLKTDITDFVQWYYQYMIMHQRDENLLHMYTFNDTHKVSELLIGYTGTSGERGWGLCYIGFRFKSDGSVWIGNTDTRELSGTLIHFRSDGLIDAGVFENGELQERMELQDIIDEYYGTFKVDPEFDILFESVRDSHQIERENVRNEFRDINDIVVNHNYFS